MNDDMCLDICDLAERILNLENKVKGLESLLKVALEALAESSLSVREDFHSRRQPVLQNRIL